MGAGAGACLRPPPRARCATRAQPRSALIQRLQPRLDLVPLRLEPGRQNQSLSEVRRIFVAGEAGAIGGELEEDTTRFDEVDRLKPEAIDLRGRSMSVSSESLAKLHLSVAVGESPGDVMNGSPPRLGSAFLRSLHEIE